MSAHSASAPLRFLQGRIEPAVLPVAAVAIVVALGFGLVVPVLPMYVRSFDVSAGQVGLVVTAFAGMRLLAAFPSGMLVSRIGSSRTVAIGCIIVSISSAAAGLAPTYAWLVVLRGMGGVGSAMFSTGLSAYLLTVIPRNRMGRAMSTFQGSFLVGSAFGPSVGGLAAGWLGLRGPFFLYAAFCAAAAVVSITVLGRATAARAAEMAERESAAVRGGRGRGDAGAGTRDAPPLRVSLTLAAALAAGFAQWWLLAGVRFTLMPLYATEHLGLDTVAIGLGLTASAIANLCLLGPAGYAADRYGRRVVGVPAFLFMAAAVGTLLLAEGLAGYVTTCVLLGAAAGAASVVPGALLADATPPERAGQASGLQHTANDAGNFVGPTAIGLLSDLFGYPPALAFAVVPLGVAVALMLASARTQQPALSSQH